MKFLTDLANRQRFGVKMGLETISKVCAALGNPERDLPVIHIAGTNGKGAIAAILDSCLRAGGFSVGRYTSPHLVQINERFFLDGRALGDETLECAAERVAVAARGEELTFFEALTAVAFLVYHQARLDFAVLETGLGGRLDATNICHPKLSVISRIGLEHCQWLGDTVEKIAGEKAGIIKRGVPVVLGRNEESAINVVRKRAEELDSRFYYAPDLVDEAEIPSGYSLCGAFNRENAITAIAAMKVLGCWNESTRKGFSDVVWPGRFQKIGNFIVDGAHNPPAASALVAALRREGLSNLRLIAGFCSDKAIDETIEILKEVSSDAIAVPTTNPRCVDCNALAERFRAHGFEAVSCNSLDEAIKLVSGAPTLVCGSLFLAGETIVRLGAYPWQTSRFDINESFKRDMK